jgi:putative ABC transport system permease protein
VNRLVISNLVHRPVRSIISIIAIAVEVILILLVVGLLIGVLEDNKSRQSNLGDVMVKPQGAGIFQGMSGAPLSEKYKDVLMKVPHVVAVAPVMIQMSTGKSVEFIYGIDLDEYQGVAGQLRYLHGGPFTGPDSIIVDDVFASGNRTNVGDSLQLFNHTFTVSGIVAAGKGARRFLPKRTMQDVTGNQGKVSIFYLKADNAANAGLIVDEIKSIHGMESLSIMTMQDWLTQMSPENLPGFSKTIDVVIGVAIIIGFIVIFQAMYTAVMERTREIGILKSLGAGKGYIINVILRETTVLAIAGTVLGIVLSFVVRAAIRSHITLPILLSGAWIGRAIVIAIVGALLGAIYPAVKAARKDPIDALAYE